MNLSFHRNMLRKERNGGACIITHKEMHVTLIINNTTKAFLEFKLSIILIDLLPLID